MKELTERGFKDAVAIKVLTIVTLVYLPTTVVTASLESLFLGTKLTNRRTSSRHSSCPRYLIIADEAATWKSHPIGGF